MTEAGWMVDVDAITPCCSRRLTLRREPGSDPDAVPEGFVCPECGRMLLVGLIAGAPSFVLAAPCETCELDGLRTEGPLCAHCARCQQHCEKTHEFTPQPSEKGSEEA
jgi:transcription elongation factor Elf1